MNSATPQSGSARMPEATPSLPPTSPEAIERALGELAEHKDEWVGLEIIERVRILERVADTTLAVADRWVKAAMVAKGIEPGTVGEGEEWIAGPVPLMRNLVFLIRSLTEIARQGHPQLPGRAFTRADGQVVAPVFPTDRWDELMYRGITGEVWMEPGVTLEELPRTQGAFYREAPEAGKIALVLGAGNVSSIGPMDALYKLFVEGQVVILKMNPVNAYLGPFFREAFTELQGRGFFRVVQGGAAEGELLCNHPLVDEIHITGSDKTHDAIVYGVGPEGEAAKAARTPRNARRITSELGNVSGIIVVPGPWSRADLQYQGRNLASSLTNNAGFNCNATRVAVQHREWKQRPALLKSLETALGNARQRKPYYPGALDRHAAFVAAHPEAIQLGERGEGKVPWTLVPDVPPENVEDICFTTEAFCAVTSETALSAPSVVEYIDRAVDFVNDTLWGTLNAAIIVHPKSLKDPRVAEAVERAVANLRAGVVAVNHWPALAYALTSPTWGAFPGHETHDIRSGRGVVHNTYLFDRPQKSVIRGPFKIIPKPAWFADHKRIHKLGPKLAAFTRKPSMPLLSSILVDALRG